jgi:thioredoxin-like negative regulator of GroEL
MIKEKLTFPVASHPVTYFFKNGNCIMHPAGGAPDDAVRKMMESLYGKPI